MQAHACAYSVRTCATVNAMFEEDHLWSVENPSGIGEASLHEQLFSNLKQRTKVTGKKRNKRKRKNSEEFEDEERADSEQNKTDTVPTASEHADNSSKRRKKNQGVESESKLKTDAKISRKIKISPSAIETPGKSNKGNQPNAVVSGSHIIGTAFDETSDLSSTHSQKTKQRSSGTNSQQTVSGELNSKMSGKLAGSRFRMINEQMYTSTSSEARVMFERDPELFGVYHKGFSTQVSKWGVNPLDQVIAYVQSLPSNTIVADFGCGEARLARSVPHTVHSFDLVAANERVTACDMAHTPLTAGSVDVCIFCLSLMGTNVSDFISEARRVLKNGGTMRVCEVVSRFELVDIFVKDVEAFGFKLLKKAAPSKMFIDLSFMATPQRNNGKLPIINLKPCIYKRR